MSSSPAGKGDRDRSNPQKYKEGLKGISGFSWSKNHPLGPREDLDLNKLSVFEVVEYIKENPNG